MRKEFKVQKFNEVTTANERRFYWRQGQAEAQRLRTLKKALKNWERKIGKEAMVRAWNELKNYSVPVAAGTLYLFDEVLTNTEENVEDFMTDIDLQAALEYSAYHCDDRFIWTDGDGVISFNSFADKTSPIFYIESDWDVPGLFLKHLKNASKKAENTF